MRCAGASTYNGASAGRRVTRIAWTTHRPIHSRPSKAYMEIKWIEDFIALAQYQSFSRAAEFRNVTQSGFSRRIQSLEQWVGAELIDRSSFPPVLTPAGQLFREVADDVLARLLDTRAIIRTEQRIAAKSLQICAGHTI